MASSPGTKKFSRQLWFQTKNGWWFLLVLTIAATLWFQRWTLTEPFNLAYLEDLYVHSQWSMPQSSRVMGDSPLYQYAGYRIVHGSDLFSINPETPPLGKYLYGWSATWGHPYWGSWLMYAAALGLLSGCLHMLPLSRSHRWTTLLVFALSPLFFQQTESTLLDLPQLVGLLFHWWALWHFGRATSQAGRGIWVTLAGIGLGLMSATKIAAFLPLILVTDLWYLWQKTRLRWALPLVIFTGLTYLMSYAPYLAQHTLWEWLRNQKWVLHFYLQSQGEVNPFNTLTVIIAGWFRGWWHDGWSYITDWNLVWPLGASGLLLWLRHHFREITQSPKQPEYVHVLLTSGLLLGSFFLIPFWPRYLLLILPGLCLVTAAMLHALPRTWAVFVWLTLLWSTVLAWRPPPQATLSLITSAWEAGAGTDLYDHLSPSGQAEWSREQWQAVWQANLATMQATTIQVQADQPLVFPWSTTVQVPLRIQYQTPVGTLDHSTQLALHREHNEWRVDWQWSNFLPQFEPQDQLIAQYGSPVVDSLVTSDGEVVAKTSNWPGVYLTVDDVHSWEVLKLLTPLTGLFEPELLAQIHHPTLPKTAKYLGPMRLIATADQQAAASHSAGITLQETRALAPLPEYREKKYLDQLFLAWPTHAQLWLRNGQLTLEKANGQRVTLLTRNESQTLMLPWTLEEFHSRADSMIDTAQLLKE